MDVLSNLTLDQDGKRAIIFNMVMLGLALVIFHVAKDIFKSMAIPSLDIKFTPGEPATEARAPRHF
jgi:hypothetical protein